jgi:hypothetical protein
MLNRTRSERSGRFGDILSFWNKGHSGCLRVSEGARNGSISQNWGWLLYFAAGFDNKGSRDGNSDIVPDAFPADIPSRDLSARDISRSL